MRCKIRGNIRFDNIFVNNWTQIRYHNTIGALKKQKRQDKIRPGVFLIVMIVITVLPLDKWTRQSAPVLERDTVFYNADVLSAGALFRRRALRA